MWNSSVCFGPTYYNTRTWGIGEQGDGRPFWRYAVATATGCSDDTYFEELYQVRICTISIWWFVDIKGLWKMFGEFCTHKRKPNSFEIVNLIFYIKNLVGFRTISVILFHLYNSDLIWNLQHFAKGEAWKVAIGAPEALERLRAAGGKIINLENWYLFLELLRYNPYDPQK